MRTKRFPRLGDAEFDALLKECERLYAQRPQWVKDWQNRIEATERQRARELARN